MSTDKDTTERLQRIESRVVRGFESLGILVTDTADWFKVEGTTITLKSGGKTISAIQIAMRKAGCPEDTPYVLNVAGKPIGSVLLPSGSWT